MQHSDGRTPILIIATGWPDAPSDGPSVSVFHLAEELAMRHEVHIAHFDLEEKSGPPGLAGSLALAQYQDHPVRYWTRAAMRRWPLPVARWTSKRARTAIIEYTRTHGIAHVVCFRTHTANLAADLDLAKVLIIQDVTSAKVLVDADVATVPLFRRLIARLNVGLFRRVEQRLWPRYDGLIVVAETERIAAADVAPDLDVQVVPIGVKLWPPAEDIPIDQTAPVEAVTYIGSLRAPRNEDAAWSLATDIMPIVWESLPDVTLRVVGARPSERLQQLATADPRVQLLGFVDDLRPTLEGAIYANPQLVGTGIKNSVLLPMLMGCAAVCSDVAVEGIDGVVGQHYLTASTPALSAAAIVSIALDSELRERLGREARSLATDSYSWGRYRSAVEAALGLPSNE